MNGREVDQILSSALPGQSLVDPVVVYLATLVSKS